MIDTHRPDRWRWKAPWSSKSGSSSRKGRDSRVSIGGSIRTRRLSRPRAERTDDDGCTRAAEEGNSQSIQALRILHSVPRPTVSGPPVGVVARRRRGGWSRFSYRVRQALTGKSGLGVAQTRARGSRSVGLVPRERRVTTATKREEDCGPRRAAKTEARECARTSFFHRLQKSIGDHCRPHRSSSTGQKAGPIARWAGSERRPSPRR